MSLTALASLLFVRNPYVVLHPQFWHEDAIIFLVQQRTDGLAAIFHPYAGYLHLFPRLVAAIAALLPLEVTPHVYLLGAYAGWLWVGGLIFTSPLFTSRRWALGATLAWVAVPHGGEVFLILTNTQWALAVGLVILLAEDPTNRGRTGRWVFVGIAALSGTQCIFLAPLAIWRLRRIKRTEGTIDAVGMLSLVAAAIQCLLVIISSHRAQDSAAFDSGRLALLLWVAVFPELFGTKATFLSDLPLRLAGTFIGMIGFAWASWVAIPGAPARRSLLLGAGLILGCGLLSVVATRGGAPMAFGGGQRYLFIPFSLYVLALVSAWSHCPKNDRRWRCAPLLLLIIGVHSAEHFIATRYRVADWPAACRILRSGKAVDIQVGPFDTHVKIPPARHTLAPSPKP